MGRFSGVSFLFSFFKIRIHHAHGPYSFCEKRHSRGHHTVYLQHGMDFEQWESTRFLWPQ